MLKRKESIEQQKHKKKQTEVVDLSETDDESNEMKQEKSNRIPVTTDSVTPVSFEDTVCISQTCIVGKELNENIIKVLIMPSNQKSKLVTFGLPEDKDCTVRNLLEEANVPLCENTKVFSVTDPTIEIDYLVETIETRICQNFKNHQQIDSDLSLDEELMSEGDDSSYIFSPSEKTGGKKSRINNRNSTLTNSDISLVESEEEIIIEKDSITSNNYDSSTSKDDIGNIKDITDIDIENAVENTEKDSVNELSIFLKCKSVMLGSYQFIPQEKIIISQNGIRLRTPTPKDTSKIVNLELKPQDIIRILFHFGPTLQVLFIWTTNETGETIRKQLGMYDPEGPYYDPVDRVEINRRIVFFSETITQETELIFKKLFSSNNVLKELKSKEAQCILARISPKSNRNLRKRSSSVISKVDTSVNEEIQTLSKSSEIMIKKSRQNVSTTIDDVGNREFQTMLVYPSKPAKGRIEISTEDYACLEKEQFLNDVIIDFYLTYLTREVLSEEDQTRTHVFSAHFYTRLTSLNPLTIESNVQLSSSMKRHANVKKWTKDVNIFEKDFIVIPIVRHSHWFLAIICFPGLVGEAEADLSVLDKNNVQNPLHENKVTKEMKEIKKNPCILIFNSLAGVSDGSTVTKILRDYLRCEYLAKTGMEKVFSKNTIQESYPDVPQQSNSSDCGIYLLQYVESFFSDPIKDYTLPIKNLENWFDENVVIDKRTKLATLIMDLSSR